MSQRTGTITIDRDLGPIFTREGAREQGWSEEKIQEVFGKAESKKSLTALILATEETDEGLVAIYGLPITDEGYDGDNGHGMVEDDKALPPGLSRWRTLKDGRHVMISTARRISRAAMARAVKDIQEVVEKGKATGMEYAIVSDSDGNRIGMVGGQKKNSVEVSSLTNRGPDEFILVHNHPSSSPFSPEDIGLLWNSDTQHVIAAGHDGTIYRASRTDGSPSREELFQRATKEGAQPWDAAMGKKYGVTRETYVSATAAQYVGFRFNDALGKYKPEMMERYSRRDVNARGYSHGLIQLAMTDMWNTLGVQYERSEVP